MRALLRRPTVRSTTTIKLGQIELNIETLEVRLGELSSVLSMKECALLQVLMKQPSKSFATGSIIRQTRGLGYSFAGDADRQFKSTRNYSFEAAGQFAAC